MNKAIEDAWKQAEQNPGEPVDIGRNVVCDDCSSDFTDSTEQGGLVFQSKGICPRCAPKWLSNAKRYGEEQFIRAQCPPDTSFADFIRAHRGPNTRVVVRPIRLEDL